ncbi:GNAT family N-acetyltransferase [Bacteroides sp.]|uniref:GNAT family N-acetyltransferase n=1 Tax=Bacteroides sp. TaxID=29523 RepID=UPI0026283AE1|nr:GNAT family N-acetyltransferase [Bacteroides sp.]
MDITIHNLSNDEVTIALELVWEVFMEFEAPDYSQEGINEFRSFLDNQDEMEKLRFWGALNGDKMVGILAMRQDHICLLFVRKEFHRQGIAKKLFCHMLYQIESDRITVNSSPYALEIYGKLGFSATNTEQITNGIRYTPMIYAR